MARFLEEFPLQVREGGDAYAYEAVHVVRADRGSRRKLQAAFVLAVLVAALALTASRNKTSANPPSPHAISESTTSLSMGKMKAAKMQSLDVDGKTVHYQGAPGEYSPPSESGYNIFDPHYSDDGVPNSYGPGGTRSGAFSGHSHGVDGGALTFGKNTFWNVFDPDGSSEMGPCSPGQFGKAGTSTQKKDCKECPVGKWCPGGEDGETANECPENTISLLGSYAFNQCTCKPGWYGIATNKKGQVSCKKCLADTYCPGGKNQKPCPEHSSSPDEAASCSCDAGYWGASADQCTPCEANNFCPGGDPDGMTETRCPSKSLSPEGSDSGTDCQCASGYYEPAPSLDPTKGPDCVLCPADTFCPGGKSNSECPANAKSSSGSTRNTDCVCKAGYYGNDGGVCTVCPAGSFCAGGTAQVKCPLNTNSLEGSTKLGDCKCNSGFMGSNPEECTICPVGSYCPSGGDVYVCGKNMLSPEGSDKSTACKCLSGYYEPNPDPTKSPVCEQCDAGTYCPGGSSKSVCPANAESLAGSVKPSDCVCKAGYYGNNGGVCTICPVGSYCPGGTGKSSCPKDATSEAGSSQVVDCKCKAGFYGNEEKCQLCPGSSFCPGGGPVSSCPSFSFSPEGSASSKDCKCLAGYYEPNPDSSKDAVCEKCGADTYCPGGSSNFNCPANAESNPGSTKSSDCVCKTGYYKGDGGVCTICPAGSFCPSGTQVKATCPANSNSAAGSSQMSDCKCKAGFSGSDKCTRCARGSFCPGGVSMSSCPANAVSEEGSDGKDDCSCSAGFYEPNPDASKDSVCVQCVAGSFCPGGASNLQCQANAESAPGSTKSSDCVCKAGYYGANGGSCTLCPAGSYCPGGTTKPACPANSVSEAGSSGISSCKCKAGFQGNNGQCARCPRGSYCPGGASVSVCPQNSASDEGSDSGNDCSCLAGYFEPNPDPTKEPTCVQCDANTYCEGGASKSSCPANAMSSPGSTKSSDCVCNPGYFFENNQCTICPVGTYCPGGAPGSGPGAKSLCPSNSVVDVTGSTKISDCVCKAGFFGSKPDACAVCPASSYCAGGNAKSLCSANAASAAESTKSSDCVCKAGYYGVNGGDCALCAAGSYCTGGMQLKCSAGMMSDAGSSKQTDCTCAAGSYGDTQTGCQQCPAGSFCPGGTVKTSCPANSDSESGQDVVDDCKCKAGYFGSGSQGCTICPRGSSCPGDGLASPCTDNSDSLAGSVSCVCLDKYYEKKDGTCSLCPSNSFCPTDSKKLPPNACPTASASPAGSTVAHQCSCVDGFSNLAYNAKANYFVVEEGTFAEVKKKCEDQNGDLASINNVVEQMTAASLCPNCWIGFESTGGPFEWVDGHEIDFTMWALGEPKNGASNAVYFLDKESDGKGQTFRWRAESGNSKYKGICKKRAVAPECVLGYSPHDLKLGTGFLTEFFYSLPSFDAMETADSKQLIRKEIAGLLTNVPSKEVVQDGVSYPSLASFSVVEPGAAGRDKMAAGFNGVLQVFKEGTYEFSSTSEDGSWVCVDSFSIVQNGGMHNPISANGKIQLKTGYHFITAVWFEAGFPVLARLKDIGKETTFSDRGGGAAQYLDRHNVNCMPQSAVSQFKLQVSQNSMKYVFDCAEGAKWGPAVGGTTTESDGGGGNFAFLDRHNVECPVGTAIAQFKLNGQANGNKISYSYNCIAPAVVNKMTCYDKTTAPSDAAGFGLKTEFLDRQAVNCDANQVMQRFQLKSDGRGNTIQYEYRCCTVDGRNDEKAMKTSPPRTGNGQFMLRYKGDDTSQTWIDVPVSHFPRAQRRLPDPNTLGMSRGWNVRVWNYPNAAQQVNDMMRSDPDTGGFPKFDWTTNSFVIGKPDAPILEKAATDMMYDDDRWKKLGAPDDNFAAVLSGFLPVYEAGQYDFWIESDDGSRLWVDNAVPVVDNGGLHGPIKKKGTVRLSHGFHAILVQFYESTGGATLKISYSGPDTGMVEQPVNVFQSPSPPGAPPAPAVGDSPLAVVTLKDPNPGGGPAIPDDQKGRNMKCSEFANNANKKNKADQLELMAKCMSQDCAQSMEAVGCLYVTPGAGFCYTDPGQLFCKNNPSSVSCVRNFDSGGEWTPVQNFPFLGGSAGLLSTGGFSTELSYVSLQQSGGIRFEGNFNCVCAKRCSYQASIKAMRCAEGSNFVGPVTGSLFDKLDPTQGKNGIVKDNGKKRECACICGKANDWRTN